MAESQVVSIDAPVDGWDAYNSLDNMPASAAVVLDNLIPGAGTVDSRKGTVAYGDTGTGLPVETVASLDTSDNSLLLVASGGGFWDMTDSPVEAAAQAITEIAPAGTYLNDRWQTGHFRRQDEEGVLILCNGEDNAIEFATPYTALADLAFTDEGVSIPGNFIGVCIFKGRAYYWYDDDDSFWYAAAGGYTAELDEYNVGTVTQRGGKIVLITTWTQQDSGDGKDDFLVIVMSTGEIIVYQGDDPGSIGFFEMVGRYNTGEPQSVRGVSKYGADTILMTKDGYIALSTIVQQGRVSDVPAFSRLISGAIQERTQRNADLFGWEAELFPKDGLFLFNVPLSDTTFEQHVMNTLTQRWCRLVGIQVNCLGVHNDRLFGGTADGKVLALLEGTSDQGKEIEFTALPAFNYLGDPGNQKHITAAQVLSTHSNPELIELTGYADFNFPDLPPLKSPLAKTSATWSIYPLGYPPWDPPQVDWPPYPIQSQLGSYWDEDYWSIEGQRLTSSGWQNVSAFGYACSILVRFNKVNEGVSWRSTTIRFYYAGAQ